MLTLMAALALTAAPQITVNHEILRGARGSHSPSVAIFAGIPFAAPPVGNLRWRAPQSPSPRAGVQRADRFAAACMQDDYNTAWYRDVGKAFGAPASLFKVPPVSEDCLYLNVWTSALNRGARRPVMVWIHGGDNKSGWTFEPNYLGDNLADRGRVVVVSIAYRVGIFGFFSHPGLRGAAEPANFGLLDQIAALKWVRENIREFGGDPGNVTVFGESAGGADIAYLLTSPLASGLFHRAIIQSGGYALREAYDLGHAEETGRALSQALPGHPSLEALRRLNATAIVETAKRALPHYQFGPAVDGISVLQAPAAAIHGKGVQYDLLIGSNANEWFMYVDADPAHLAGDLDALPARVRPRLAARAAREPSVQHGRDAIERLPDMLCPSYLLARSAVAAGHRGWVYQFTKLRAGPGSRQLLVYHGAEIAYAFDTHDAWLPTDAADRRLTAAMLRYWSNFARSGDPNDGESVNWPAVGTAGARIMELGAQIRPIKAPDDELCRAIAADIYPGW